MPSVGDDDCAVPPEPRRIYGLLDHAPIVPAALDVGTAAQIVRAYGRAEIQVNDLLPPVIHQAIGHHIVSRHRDFCHARACSVAAAWLRGLQRPVLAAVDAESA